MLTIAEQKQMLVDAILMMERAQVIDFNGHIPQPVETEAS